jgi:hypothetical protein
MQVKQGPTAEWSRATLPYSPIGPVRGGRPYFHPHRRPVSTAKSPAAPAAPAKARGRSAVAQRVRAGRCLRPAHVLRPLDVMMMRWRR